MLWGAKYRPGNGPAVFTADTRHTVIDCFRGPTASFARQSEERLGTTGVMQRWKACVMTRVTEIVDAIPLDEPLQERIPISYDRQDVSRMRAFLHGLQGHGVVCTTMDKAANTLVFRCPKTYVTDILQDFHSASVYCNISQPPEKLVATHNAFLTQYSVPVDSNAQGMPYYTATVKMHKDPPGNRYISADSSMKTISLGLNKLFNALLPEVDKLFAAVMRQAGIHAEWTHRSWVLKNSAEVIPLIHGWNQIYSSKPTTSFSSPIVETYDFERLYTSIDTSDMQTNIMQLVRGIFGLQEHRV